MIVYLLFLNNQPILSLWPCHSIFLFISLIIPSLSWEQHKELQYKGYILVYSRSKKNVLHNEEGGTPGRGYMRGWVAFSEEFDWIQFCYCNEKKP
jgi:hypothetical protein